MVTEGQAYSQASKGTLCEREKEKEGSEHRSRLGQNMNGMPDDGAGQAHSHTAGHNEEKGEQGAHTAHQEEG